MAVDCSCIGGHEILLEADTQHQRAAATAGDQGMGLVLGQDGQGIGALKAFHGRAHRGLQVAVVEAVDQVGDHFGVGFRCEFVPPGDQFLAQGLVILDDAVVHHGV